jgi:hypothetical protein
MAQCEAEGCVEFRFDVDAAVGVGWEVVNGKLYCPCHAGPEGFQARREAKREDLIRRTNKIIAKNNLSAGDYRAWDEFQADLANFHRDHGRPAHRELRIMPPSAFIARRRSLGRIDIALADDALNTAEVTLQERRMERFRQL